MNRVVLRERRQPTSFITSPLPDLHYVSTHNDWILIDYGGESITGVDRMVQLVDKRVTGWTKWLDYHRTAPS